MALVTSALTIPPAASINAAAAPRRLAAAAWRSVVPLVYGEDRITGLLLNVLAHATDVRLVLVQVLWCHACDSVNDVLLNDEALPAGTGATHYVGAQIAADATLAAAFAAQGITYTDTLAGYAYSVLALPVAAFTGQLNVSARIKGRKLYDPRLDSTQPGGSGSHRLATPGTWAWSSCPALALADWLYSPTYGAGEPVDWVSVQAAANANDALIGSPSEVRRLIGTTFAQQVRVQEMADALRAYASCWLVPTAGGIKLLPDAHGAAAASYAHAAGQIAALDALTKRDLGDTPTAVEVIYTDRSATPWRDASVTVNLPGAGSTRPWRLSTIRLPGIQRYSQAKREATERLNKFTLNDLSCAIEVFDVGICHELGDIVEITHPIGPASKPMRVVDAPEMVAPGRWRLALVEHDPAAYSTAVETEPTYADTGRVIGWQAQGGRNLLDASTWVLKSDGSQPGFAQNGQTAENLIDTIQAPDGSYSPGWIMYAGGLSGGATYADADGGFDTDPVPIDSTKAYRFRVWVCSRGSATAGWLYLGCGANSVQPVAGGPPDGNPYFERRAIPDHVSGNWYLYVGYVFGEDYDSGQANRSGIYDAVTGAKVQSGTDFKWVAGQPTTRLRAYQFYANAAANRSDLWGPAIELCDGSEPSIAQLLATAAVSARNPITSSNAATYVGAAAIDDSRLSSLGVDKLTAGSVAVSAYLQSTGFVSGSSGWRIKGDGSAEFAAAMIRDQLTASQINVSSLSSLSANLGTITAGTITLDSSGFIRAGQTAYDTGAGFHLGYAGGAYKFSVGDASRALLWDGSTLTVRGDVIATSNIQLRAVSQHKWSSISTTLTISGSGGYPSFPGGGIGTQKASDVVTVASSSSPPLVPKDAVYSAIFAGTVTAALKSSLPATGNGWDLYVSYRLRVKDSDGGYLYGPTMKQRAPLYITASDQYTAQITTVRTELAAKALVELAVDFLDVSILRRAYETATFGTLEALDTVSVAGNGAILVNLV